MINMYGTSQRLSGDYFSSLPHEDRIRLAERFMTPEPDLDLLGDRAWGVKGLGVYCVGDSRDMRKVVDKGRHDALTFVADRLPIWC